MTSKIKTKKTTKQRIVRITIDNILAVIIDQIKAKYPLLNDIEALKIVISQGVNNNQNATITNSNQSKFTPESLIDINSALDEVESKKELPTYKAGVI